MRFATPRKKTAHGNHTSCTPHALATVYVFRSQKMAKKNAVYAKGRRIYRINLSLDDNLS